MKKDKVILGRNFGCGLKRTLSSMNIMKEGCAINAAISPIRHAEAMAIKNTVFTTDVQEKKWP